MVSAVYDNGKNYKVWKALNERKIKEYVSSVSVRLHV